MNIAIQANKFQDLEGIRSYVKRRLSFAFDQHERHIHRVEVKLLDTNGPRGGIDKCCRIQVFLRKVGEVFVEHVESNIFNAINRASERATRAISSRLRRQRSRKHHQKVLLLPDDTQEILHKI